MRMHGAELNKLSRQYLPAAHFFVFAFFHLVLQRVYTFCDGVLKAGTVFFSEVVVARHFQAYLAVVVVQFGGRAF